VVGVWVGNPDGSPSDQLVGRKAATPIAWDLFRRMYPDNEGPWFARPAGVEERTVCAVSGCAPGPHCGRRIGDWGIARVTRHEVCPVHRGGPEDTWPAAVASFLARRAAPAAEEAEAEAVRIVAPARGSTYRWMPDLDVDAQKLALEAASDRAGEAIHWFVDDRSVGKSRAGEPLFWPLEQGTHQIVCSTARGLSDRVEIAVE